MAQALARNTRIIAMFNRALERAKISAVIEGTSCRLGNRVYDIKVRSSPAFPERILEVIKAHLYESYLRERGRDAIQDTLLTIRIPRFPAAGRFIGLLDSLTCERPALAAWAIVSDGGGAYLSFPHAEGVEIPDDLPLRQPRMAKEPRQSKKDPWASDVALALLTILLMQRAEPRSHWGAWTPITAEQDVEDMAVRLNVGRSTIYGIINALAERGWLEAKRGSVPRLIDPLNVINWLFDRGKHALVYREAVAPLYIPTWQSPADVLSWLKPRSDDPSIAWAITGWHACSFHGLGILVDHDAKPVEIVVQEPISAVMKGWKLRRHPSPGMAVLLISQSAMPTADFSCMGQKIDGLHVIDPLHAALAVIRDSLRGLEQATAIADSLWREK